MKSTITAGDKRNVSKMERRIFSAPIRSMRVFAFSIAFLITVAGALTGFAATVHVVLNNTETGTPKVPVKFYGEWIYTGDTSWARGNEMQPWLHNHYHFVEENEGTCPSIYSGYAGKSKGMASYLGAKHISVSPGPTELLTGYEIFDPAKELQYFGWTTKIIDLAQAYSMGLHIPLDTYNTNDRDDTAAGWEDRLRARVGALVEACRAKYGSLPMRVSYGVEPSPGPGKTWDDNKVRYVQCLGVAYPYLKGRWPTLKVGAYISGYNGLGTAPDFDDYVLQQRNPLLYDFVANDYIHFLKDQKIDTDSERIEASYTSGVASEGFQYYSGTRSMKEFRQKLLDIGVPGDIEFIGQAAFLGHGDPGPTYQDDVNVNVPWLNTTRNGKYHPLSNRFMGVAGVQWMMKCIAPVKISGTWYPGAKFWNWQAWPGVGGCMHPETVSGKPSSVSRMGEVIYSAHYFSGIIAKEINGRIWYAHPTFTGMVYRLNQQGTNISLIEAWSLRETSTNTHYVVLINHDSSEHTIVIDKNGVPGSATTGTLIMIGVGPMGNRAQWICTADDTGYVDNLPAESTETISNFTTTGFSLHRMSAAVFKFSTAP